MTSIHSHGKRPHREEQIDRLRCDLHATATLAHRLGIDPDEALRIFAALLRTETAPAAGNPEENRP